METNQGNEVEVVEEALPGFTLEQLSSLYGEFGPHSNKRANEFTIKEFGEAVKIGYDRAKATLMKAAEKGELNVRRYGSRTFYSKKSE